MIVVCLSIVIFMPIVHQRLQKVSESFKGITITAIENAIGQPLSYGAIDPNIVSGITINDLVIYESGIPVSAPNAMIAIKRIKVGYSLIGLIFGKAQISHIGIEDAVFVLDTQNEAGLISFFTRLLPKKMDSDQSELDQINDFPLEFTDDASVSLRRIQLKVSDPLFQGTLSVSRVLIRGFQGDPVFVVSADAEGIANFAEVSTPVFGDVIINGRIAESFESIDAQIHIRQLATEFFTVKDQQLGVLLSRDSVVFRRRTARDPVELSAEYHFNAETAILSLQADRYRLGSIIDFHSSLGWLNQWAQGSFSGDAMISWYLPANRIRYSIGMDVQYQRLMGFGRTGIKVNADGSESIVKISRLTLENRQGNLDFVGSVRIKPEMDVSGNLEIQNLTYNDLQLSSASFAISTENGEISLCDPAPVLSSGNLGKICISVLTRYTWGLTMDVRVGLPADEKYPNSKNGELYSQVIIPYDQIGDAVIRYRIRNLSAGMAAQTFWQFAGVPSQDEFANRLHDIHLSSSGIIRIVEDDFSLYTSKVEINDEAGYQDSVEFSLSADRSRVLVQGVKGSVFDAPIQGSLAVKYSSGSANIDMDLLLRDHPYRISGTAFRNGRMELNGSYGLKVAAAPSASGYVFHCVFDEFPIPLPEDTVLANLSVLGSFSSLDKYHLRVDRIQLSNLPDSRFHNVATALRLKPGSVVIPGLQIMNEGRTRQYEGFVELIYDHSAIRSGGEIAGDLNVTLKNDQSGENYLLQLVADESMMEGRYQIQNFPVGEYLSRELGGNVSLEGQIAGSFEKPEISGSFTFPRGRFRRSPVTAQGDFAYDSVSLLVRNLNGEFEGIVVDNIDAELVLASYSLTADGNIRITDWIQDITSVELSVIVTLGEKWPEHQRLVNADTDLRALLFVRNETQGRTDQYTFRGRGTGERFVVDGGKEGTGFSLSSNEVGEFDFDIYDPFPIQAQGYGVVEKDRITLDIPNLF
ncbi:MAG: hypothetical protein D6B26_07000, partial [Spirochaetaceae bacterium]